MSVSKQRQSYEFGSFRIDCVNRLLSRDGESVPLQPKMFEMLLLLVENRGQVLEKDELMRRLWPDTVVEESNLTQNVYVLRKILGADPEGHRYIETIPKRGYRFTANVQELQVPGDHWILEKQTVSRIVVEEELEGALTARLDEDKAMAATVPRRAAWIDQENGGLRPLPEMTPASQPARGIVATVKRHKTGAALAFVAGLIAVAVILWSTLGPVTRVNRSSPKPFQELSISRLTDIGRVVFPTISPDGKYLAYVSLDDEERRSIWVKHIATGSATEVVSAVPNVGYESLVFSHDGNYIYFNRSDKGAPYELHQVPALGGAARKLIDEVWGAVTLSPDGKRLAFIRAYWNTAEHALIVASADGTDEQALATRRSPEYFNIFGIGPAWSPDGKRIACGGGNSNDDVQCVVEVREDGSERIVSSERWDSIGQLAWVADGAGLLFLARKQPSLPQQIWYMSYPEGDLRRITNDLSAYDWLAVTADSSILVAQRSEFISNIWVVPNDRDTRHFTRDGSSVSGSRAQQITFGVGKFDGYYGVCWTPDGKIIYSSDANGNRDLWMMNSDGMDQRQLTINAGDFNAHPSITRDGRYVVFSSNRAGAQNIWRMDADGRNPKQLTTRQGEYRACVSPDGQWVIYESGPSNRFLWKVSIDGGEPMQLTDKYQSGGPVVSPDGKLIAYGYFDEQINPPWRIGIMPFEGGPPIETFSAGFRGQVRWTLDGGALTYIDGSPVSNIWSQPLAGGMPKRLSNFKEMRIYYFDWSRDGKWLACARGTSNSDAVMIRDLVKERTREH